jgi:alpha-tubulin suppressor-like RCC1 family protein
MRTSLQKTRWSRTLFGFARAFLGRNRAELLSVSLAVSVVIALVSTLSTTTAAFTSATENVANSFTADTLAAPTSLTTTDGITISLSWTATTDSYATGHRIFRSSTPGGPYTQVAEVTPRSTVTYVDSPEPGIWYYVARSYYLGWESVDTAEKTAEAISPELFVSLGGGLGHTCGSRFDGTVWCWGRNDKGQVGNDLTGADEDLPVQVVGAGGAGLFADATEVVAGTSHSCAVKTDGTVWCWGLNDRGQLGDNTTGDSDFPVQVVGVGGSGTLANVTSISAGLSHTCAAKTDNTAWCWGHNTNGQLGDNTGSNSITPVQVAGAGGSGTLADVSTVSAGSIHTCAAKTDGTAWCWGRNDRGQLGDNTTSDSDFPVQVVGAGGSGTLADVSTVSAGLVHTCAAKTDGTAWCWGRNDKGQLGDGIGSDSITPVQVAGAGGIGTIANVTTISVGLSHTCVSKSDNTAWCWGLNNLGQLGDNTTSDSDFPVQVVGVGGIGTLANVTLTGTGTSHSCAARDDDTVLCWGLNTDAQLGNNTTTNSNYPVQAIGI